MRFAFADFSDQSASYSLPEKQTGRLFWRNAKTSRRDACATQANAIKPLYWKVSLGRALRFFGGRYESSAGSRSLRRSKCLAENAGRRRPDRSAAERQDHRASDGG